MSSSANYRAGDTASTVTVKAKETCFPQYYSLQQVKHTIISLIAGKAPDEARAMLAKHGLYSVSIRRNIPC